MPLFLDVTPLRVNAAFRRLFTGFTLAGIGGQVAVVAIGLQVYGITGSTFSVGLVGLFALVPIVVMGLYGGALVDVHDRRTVALVAGAVMWLAGTLGVLQALLGNTHVGVLYALVSLNSAGFAVASPARSSIWPRLLRREQLPAANALNVLAMNLAFTGGPLLAGVLVDRGGYVLAYSVDALLYSAAMWGLLQLDPMPPLAGQGPAHDARTGADPAEPGGNRRAGLSSVLDGLRFLRTRPNLRMTFLADLAAMVLAQPRALMPAVAVLAFGGGATTVGVMTAGVAAGSLVAMLFSGRLGNVRRQGLAVVVSVAGWGASIAGFGLCIGLAGTVLPRSAALWAAVGALAAAGAADAVSSVYRQTILQAATPDHLRGRLQGVFVVVVAGGPRLGDVVAGVAATAYSEASAGLVGGLACIVVVGLLALRQRGFLRYDAWHPTP